MERPFLGFGVNWNPYWDKPSSLPAKALHLSDDEWQTIVTRLDFMNMKVMRVMMLPEWVNPTAEAGANDYDTPMMRALYRVLDYTKLNGITVLFGFWDGRKPFEGVADSPLYIQTMTEVVHHLVNHRGYSNIKYFILANEPQHRLETYAQYRQVVENLAAAFQQSGLTGQVKIMGPDVGGDGQTWLGSSSADLQRHIGSYDWHYYPSAEAGIKDGSPENLLLGHAATILTNDAEAATKPLVLAEMGWFHGVTQADNQPNIASPQYALEVMDLGLQAARAGWSSVAWYLDDQTNDKLWGMWDIKTSPTLRPWFYTWSLLTKYFQPDMTLYRPASAAGVRILVGRQSVDGANRWSIAIVNRHAVAQDITITIPAGAAVTLRQFTFKDGCPAKDKNGFPLPTGTVTGNLAAGITLSAPAESGMVLTDLKDTSR